MLQKQCISKDRIFIALKNSFRNSIHVAGHVLILSLFIFYFFQLIDYSCQPRRYLFYTLWPLFVYYLHIHTAYSLLQNGRFPRISGESQNKFQQWNNCNQRVQNPTIEKSHPTSSRGWKWIGGRSQRWPWQTFGRGRQFWNWFNKNSD